MNPFEKLQNFLKENNMQLSSTCQTGCDLRIEVNGKEIGEFHFFKGEFKYKEEGER